MSLNIKRLTFGDIIKFTVDGTAITNMGGAAVSSSIIFPDGTTPADWKDFATVEKGTITSKATDEEVMSPSPGAYRRVDVIRSLVAHDLKITCQEVNELILQSVFQTVALVNATAATVQGGLGQVRGWLQISRASQNDNVALLLQLYGIMNVKDLNSDGKMAKPEVDFAVLYNTGNKITPTLAAA